MLFSACWTFLRWTKAAAGSAPSLRSTLTISSHTLSAARPGLVGGTSMRTVAGSAAARPVSCFPPPSFLALLPSPLPTKLTPLRSSAAITSSATRACGSSALPSARVRGTYLSFFKNLYQLSVLT
uniref:Secreted protein n=1 Tax=Zea mays TaxID=4577 RepID=B6U3U6_MAIZE|nr:hypothetical protein [Zea mays]